MEMHANDDFSVAFDFASGATAERFQNPLWPITEFFFGSRFRHSISVVKAFGATMVDKAQKDRPMAQSDPDTDRRRPAYSGRVVPNEIEGSLIQSLLGSIRDVNVVSDAALNYLSAGRDTTAQALTWTFYVLMKRPDVVAKIRDEVLLQITGYHGKTCTPSYQTIIASVGNIVSLPYTHAVFNESLRLYPPIPFEIKQSMEATVLPDGTQLPKNSVVVWCPWAMNRSRHTWGSDAHVFRPQRWLDETGAKVLNRSASEFPVFNGGSRTCLGKRMAEILAIQVIAVMVTKFDFVQTDPGERVSKSSLTLPMDGGLPCRLRIR